jgi:hypothetical protein
VPRFDDRYMPGAETAEGQEIRAASGLADFLRHRRSIRGFTGPMVAVLALGAVVIAAVVIAHVL